MTSLFSSGPILEGIGVNITAWSYVDTMYISVLGCSASLPDPWRLTGDLVAESDSWADWIWSRTGTVGTSDLGRSCMTPVASCRRTRHRRPGAVRPVRDRREVLFGPRPWWHRAPTSVRVTSATKQVEKRLARQPMARMTWRCPAARLRRRRDAGRRRPGVPSATHPGAGRSRPDGRVDHGDRHRPQPLPTPGRLPRVADELSRAHDLFSERAGWTTRRRTTRIRPSREPPSPGWALGHGLRTAVVAERLPRLGVPGTDRWLAFESNRTASAWVLRHRDGPRPWVVCVHGSAPAGVHGPVRLPCRAPHEQLGVNVAAIVLPVHGARRPSRLSGEEFLGFEFMNSVHGLTQAVWDVRRLLSWVRRQDPTALGVFGVSLGGGMVTGLVSAFRARPRHGVDRHPDRRLPGPDRAPPLRHLQMRSIEHNIPNGTAQDVHKVVSPLAMAPVTRPA